MIIVHVTVILSTILSVQDILMDKRVHVIKESEMYHIPKFHLTALNSIFGINNITHIMPGKNALEATDIKGYHKRICNIKEAFRNIHNFRPFIIHLHIQIYQILDPLALSPCRNRKNIIIDDFSPEKK